MSSLLVSASPTLSHAVKEQAALQSKVRAQGSVSVVVLLKTAAPVRTEQGLQAAAVAEQRGQISSARQQLFNRFPQFASRSTTRQYDDLPIVGLEVNEEELNSLKSNPNVLAVRENRQFRATLAQSVPLVGADNVWTNSNKGAGQLVAILDTGVDKDHPFLAGKVVAEACYSTSATFNGGKTVNLCPGGVDSTAAGSGVHCPTSLLGCHHGTHVAGIAAGKGGGTTNVTYSGVAPEAGIVAIQVFSKVVPDGCSADNCSDTTAYFLDVLDGLRRVVTLANAGSKIASVNLSLGTDETYPNSSECDSYLDNNDVVRTDEIKQVIDQLSAMGIPTVIAAGNAGPGHPATSSGISYPACISSAVSVAATSKSDYVASYSYNSPSVSLLAPGGEGPSSVNNSIVSSLPSDGMLVWYGGQWGTSMAAPHVAGSFALLKARKPTATVAEMLGVLQSTGVPVVDSRFSQGYSKPRIKVDTAANFLLKPITVTKVSSDPNNTQHTLSWGTAADTLGLAGFQLTVNGTTTSLGAVSSTTIPLTPGTQHTLSLRARDSRGTLSPAVSRTYSYADTLAPTPPTSLVAYKLDPLTSSTQTRLLWMASTDNVAVTGYKVSIDGGPWMNTNSTATTWTTVVTAGVPHTIRVAAVDAAGNLSAPAQISYTAFDTVKPSAPTGLAATKASPATSSVSTLISWNAASDDVGVTGYRLTVDGVVTVLGNVTSTTRNLSLGAHSISVVAVDAAGNQSAASATFNHTVSDTVKPSLPAGLSITKVSTSTGDFQHRISWNAASDDVGVARYKVQVYAGSIAQPVVIDVGTALSHTLPVMPNTSYKYAVAAYDAVGNYSLTSYSSYSYTGSCQSNYGAPGAMGSASASIAIGSIPTRWVTATGSFFTQPGVLPNNFVRSVSIRATGPGGQGIVASTCGLSVTADRQPRPTQGGESGPTMYTAVVCDYYGVCVEKSIDNTVN